MFAFWISIYWAIGALFLLIFNGPEMAFWSCIIISNIFSATNFIVNSKNTNT